MGLYPILLTIHSFWRWAVVLSLGYSLVRAYYGWLGNKAFKALDNSLRHNTATIAHVQLVLGFLLYFQSPVVKMFFDNTTLGTQQMDLLFFGALHIALMTIAIVIITVGSALAKRKSIDQQKFQTMAIWFTIAAIIIFIAIPWPFSPFATRPYLRSY